mmetsp:Transcript_6840/g.25565  ORF Transcript_6840/g.25565 Transcript_6840/m.25565 type:complete len:373 (-) Transcript_6840:40-1158(-)
MPKTNSRGSSSEFIYAIGIFLAVLISLSCLISLAPISFYLVAKKQYVDEKGLGKYNAAVKEWTETYRDRFSSNAYDLIDFYGPEERRFPMDKRTDSAPFSERDTKELNLPTYEGLYHSLPGHVLYEDVIYDGESDLSSNIVVAFQNEIGKATGTKISIFEKDTRRVTTDAECKGEIVGRLMCKSVWRLTGFCILMDDDGSESGAYIEGMDQPGCYPGPNGAWGPGIYGEQVVKSASTTHTLNTTVTLRSRRDPYITAAFATNQKFTFVESYLVKFILGIVLLVACGSMAVLCCIMACIGTGLFCHTKRMEKKFEYSDLATSEAEGPFSNNDTQFFDDGNSEEDSESDEDQNQSKAEPDSAPAVEIPGGWDQM